MFAKPAVSLLLRMSDHVRRFAADEKTEAFGIGLEFITILVNLLPSLLALCKKPAPTPPPVPASLKAVGVSPDTWKTACDSKWASTEAWNKNTGKFNPLAVRDLAKDLMDKEPGLKLKAARVKARAALESGRTEEVEVVALAMHASQAA